MRRERRDSPAGEKRLEQYGVWVKAEPREVLQSPRSDDAIELSDLESQADTEAELPDFTDESPLTSEEEKLLDELETELEPVSTEGKDLPELTLEPETGEEVEVSLSDSLPVEEHFDDLQALEDELASVTSASAPVAASAGQSAEILARIEEELRSIRTDLTELKKELAGLRKPGAAAAQGKPSAEPEGPAVFFDEDEDETIALTGDELDNILNTADITEGTAEAAAPVEEEPSADSLDLEALDEPSSAGALPVEAATEELPADDILSYETPILEEDRLAPVETVDGAEEIAELEPELDDAGADLAADLVLETVPSAKGTRASSVSDPLADLDLESLPEIEGDEQSGEPAELEPTIGLDAVELDTADLEPVDDLEPEERETSASHGAGVEGPADEIDLEALARETEEAADPTPLGLDIDLETAELEPVAELESAGDGEIEIAFESEGKRSASASKADPVEELLEVEDVPDLEPAPPASPARPAPAVKAPRPGRGSATGVPEDLKEEIRNVLKYMDQLLEALPEDKVEEFARSEYFAMYNKLFKELGLGE